MNVEFLVLPNGKCPIEDFLDGIDEKTSAKVQRYIQKTPDREIEKVISYLNQVGVKI